MNVVEVSVFLLSDPLLYIDLHSTALTTKVSVLS